MLQVQLVELLTNLGALDVVIVSFLLAMECFGSIVSQPPNFRLSKLKNGSCKYGTLYQLFYKLFFVGGCDLYDGETCILGDMGLILWHVSNCQPMYL